MKLTIKLRAITSLLLIIVFTVVLFSGFGLHFAPIGRIARETAWTFLGLDKLTLEKMHTLSGFIMSGLIFFHLFLNYKLLIQEVKLLFKK